MQNSKYINHLTVTLTVLFVVLIVFVLMHIFTIMIDTHKKVGDSVIEVSAEAEVFSRPDIALVSFSVTTEENDADKALSLNAEKVNSIMNYLKGVDIKEEDMKTTTFDIRPRYEYHRDDLKTGTRVLVGYEARQSVEVKIREMEDIGEVLEGGVKSGANQVSNLTFTIEDESELKREARNKAIEKAKEEAGILEDQLGISLGRIVDFSEDVGGIDLIGRSFMEGQLMADSSAPEIATGENKITSRVRLIFEIK